MTLGPLTLPIPCAVVTGALGSGKTTLIRDWMRLPEMAGTALIINEFGEIGIDHLLVSSAVETTLLMENGCLCCSLRGDLVDMILNLFGAVERNEIPPFHRILIETTGLADPVSIVRDLTSTPILKGKVLLASVATAVDGVLAQAGLEGDPVAINQVAQADICLITKTDLADPLALDALRETLSAINPLMAVYEVRGGKAPPGDLLYSGKTIRSGAILPAEGARHGHHSHEIHGGVQSWSTTLDHPLPWSGFRNWLDMVYSLNAAAMLRMKGLLWVAERPRPILVQAVGPSVAPPESLATWPEDRRCTRLVMITRGLAADALARSFSDTVMYRCVSAERNPGELEE